jgi:hypothetical protein
MGHSKIQTTFDVYGHLLPGSRDEVWGSEWMPTWPGSRPLRQPDDHCAPVLKPQGNNA